MHQDQTRTGAQGGTSRFLAFAVGLIILIGIAGCGQGSGETDAESSRNAEPDASAETVRSDPWQDGGVIRASANKVIAVTGGQASGYVADVECAACHSAIAREYADLGMGRSAFPPEEAEWIEDFENNHFYHALSNRHYEMLWRDGDLFQKRYQLDTAGNKYNVLERRVDFIIGSGNKSRSYVYRTEAGELFQLPVVWYTDTASWGMAPGYDRERHRGFSRRISHECMFCHNAYPDTTEIEPGGPAELAIRHPENLPHGIGCQRCHGPGADHVRIAYDLESSEEDVRTSIVNPVTLPRAEREDVCLQCHLEPSSEVTSRIVRRGRAPYSYRAGEPLDAHMVVLNFQTEIAGEERFDINHHPYRLHQSLCYTQSGSLDCLTCHDPHRPIPEVERVAWYRAKCLECHDLEHCNVAADRVSTGALEFDSLDCASCHMPQRRSQDVIQAVLTDHRIAVYPEDDSRRIAPLKERGRPEEPIHYEAYWPDREIEYATLREYIAIALADDEQVASLELFESLPSGSGTLGSNYHHAYSLALADRAKEAHDVLLPYLQREADSAAGHLLMAQLARALGDLDASLEHMQRVVELDPLSDRAHYGLGMVLLARNDTVGALEAFHEAARLNPTNTSAIGARARMLSQFGRRDEAVVAYREVLAVDPSTLEAFEDLAVNLLILGQPAEAKTVVVRGFNVDERSSALREVHAAILAFDGEPSAARRAIDLARDMNASEANCRLIEAVVAARSNDAATARRLASSAGAIEPGASYAARELNEVLRQWITARLQ